MKEFLKHVLTLIVGALTLEAIHVAFNYYKGGEGQPSDDVALLKITLVVIFLTLVILLIGIMILVRRFDETESALRSVLPSFTYYAVEHEADRDLLFDRTLGIIRGANVQILAINAWREEWRDPDVSSEFRDSYFEALIAASRRVPYRRLVQLDEERSMRKEFDLSYVKHFKDMLNEKESRGPTSPRIELDRLRPLFPSTFVLVDGEYLLWQLNEVANSKKAAYAASDRKYFWMRAVVIVHDKKGDFIKHFMRNFDAACRKVERAVTPDDLHTE